MNRSARMIHLLDYKRFLKGCALLVISQATHQEFQDLHEKKNPKTRVKGTCRPNLPSRSLPAKKRLFCSRLSSSRS
jgi:hypothetical protein